MKIAFLLLFLCLQNSVSAQVSAELPKMNVMYIGLPNPLNVVAEEVKHEDLRLSCTQCTIADSNGQHIVYVSKRGDLNIYIKHKNGDTLAVKNFRVRSIPKPELRFGTLESGTFSRGAIMAQPGLYATLGEGFAYTGVAYHVDSAYVEIETIEGVILCKQDGTRLAPEIRAAMAQPFSRIVVTEPYVSLKGGGDSRRIAPVTINNYNFLTSIENQPLNPKSPTYPALGKCYVWPHDSIHYIMDGHRHEVLSKIIDSLTPNNVLHLVDGDTLFQVQNARYKSFYQKNVLKEEGIIFRLNDSLWNSHVEGRFIQSPASTIVFEKGESEVISNIERRMYPIGEWKYYHQNGKLFAIGSYAVYQADSDHFNCYFDGGAPDILYVVRKGVWKFYDENGQLILEKEYP